MLATTTRFNLNILKLRLSGTISRLSSGMAALSKNDEVRMVKEQLEENKNWISVEKSKNVNLLQRFATSPPQSGCESSSMREYIMKRYGNDCAGCEPFIRITSSLLTYPLTLTYGLSKLFMPHNELDEVNVLIIGGILQKKLWSFIF